VLAARAGLEDLLALARTIELHGRAGVLVAHVILEVPEDGVPGRAASDADREPMPRAGDRRERTGPPEPGRDGGQVDVRTLLHEMKGARLQGRVAVAENLVNAVIGVALQSVRDTGDGARAADEEAASPGAGRREVEGSTLAAWIQRARVQFLNGRMVLDLDVVIT
jgi:hypothetical protein